MLGAKGQWLLGRQSGFNDLSNKKLSRGKSYSPNTNSDSCYPEIATDQCNVKLNSSRLILQVN
jgi:hypothetical protein